MIQRLEIAGYSYVITTIIIVDHDIIATWSWWVHV